MKFLNLVLIGLFLVFFISIAEAQVKLDEFTLGETCVANSCKLLWKGKEIGSLQIIGPEKPILLKIENKTLGHNESVYMLHYDAGIAGTLTQIQIERVLLFTENKGEISIGNDHIYKIVRFQGDNTLMDETRKIKIHNKEINFEAFDEEDPIHYKLIQGKLISLNK